jgi:uncharacterized membrane protein
MHAKVKYPVFIDAVKLELVAKATSCLKAVLKDDKGSVCSTFETSIPDELQHEYTWKGLNHLPYGVYTLQLSQGEDEVCMRLVKRV